MRRTVVLVLLAVWSLCAVLAAQEVTGRISGTVKDPSGAVVPNAKVTLTNTDKNAVARTVTTDASGNFSAPLLPIGNYSLTVEAPGFQTFTQKGIVLNVADKLTFFPTLQLGSAQQAVTVEANAQQVDLQSTQAAGLVTGTQVVQLSLNNRNYEQLVSLVPGVTSSANTDQIYVGAFAPQGTNVVQFSMNGGRTEENNWLVDGIDNVDRGSNITLLSFPSVDAIAQFKVMRGQYDPEFGRAASGQIDVVTRSGTSAFHGGAYEFFRNDVLNANSFFNNQAHVKRPRLRYNNFGWNLGGPVYIPGVYNKEKNKTFFFFSQEFRRVITYSNPTLTEPTAAERGGTFANPVCTAWSGTTCAATGTSIASIDPLAAAYLKDIYGNLPAPNSPTNPHGFVSTLRNIFNFREEMLKIDQIFSSKFQVSGKILRDSIPTEEPLGIFGGTSRLPFAGTTQTNSPGHNYTLRATLALTPNTLIEAGYGYSYGAIVSRPVGLLTMSKSPDIKPALPFPVTLGRVPSLTFTGGTALASFGPYNDFNRNHTFFANFSHVMGGHQFKFGGTYYHYQKTENSGNGNQGTFAFNAAGKPAGSAATNFEQSWANFLLGHASSFSQDSFDMTPDIRDNQLEWYAQDAWRMRPNFTLTYGMRWSFFRQPTDAKGLLSNFDPKFYNPADAPQIDPTTGNIVAGTGNPLNGFIYTNPPAGGMKSPFGSKVGPEFNHAIAPRIGFAWDPWNDGRTSIRAGYGMFYDAGIEFGNPEINIFVNPPFVQSVTFLNTTLGNPTGGTLRVSAAPKRVRSLIADPYHSPYTQQWSFDIQRQLAGRWMLDLGYYGNNGIHLPGALDINQPKPDAYLAAGIGQTTPCPGAPSGWSTTPPCPITSASTPLLNPIRPYVGYLGIDGIRDVFTSNYHSLQTQLQRTWGASLVNISYTWSHGLTTIPFDRSVPPQNTYDLKADYGPTAADRRHVITANFVWSMPFLRDQQGFVGHVLGGWELSGIQTFQTGAPLTISTDSDLDPAGQGCLGPSPCQVRPDMIADPMLNAPRTFNEWFNTAAFADVPPGQFRNGNARRGTVYGPGFWRTDLSLFKNIKITERVNSQFRLESFNLFNHTNPVCCTSTFLGDPGFGQISSTRDPRIVQLGLKLNF